MSVLSPLELMPQVDLSGYKRSDVPILGGGPVEPQRGFVLHTFDWGGQDILHVGNQWGLSGSLDVLRAISEGGGPSRYVIALGYAGWGQGQLEEEMTRHGWFVAPVSDQLLRSEEHTSELQSLMRISYAVFCLQKKKTKSRNR